MGYQLQTPWDMSGPAQEPEETPAAPPKKKPPTEEETAAYGGNAALYAPPKPQAPALPKTPWDQTQPGVPASRAPAQGQRAAPASTPSLNLSPVGAPGAAASSAPKTRGYSVPSVGTASSIGTTIYDKLAGGATAAADKIAGAGNTAADKVSAAGTSATGGGWQKILLDALRPSVATTPIPGATNTAVTTGTPPPGPDDIPIQFDEGEQSTKVPTSVQDIIAGMSPEDRKALSNILTSGKGRTPVTAVGSTTNILGPILEGEKQIPVLGPILDNVTGGNPLESPDSGTIASDPLKGIFGDKADFGEIAKDIPGYNGATGIMSTLGDVLSNPGKWFEDMGKKIGDFAGFNDLGAQGYMDDVIQSARDQYGHTIGINQQQDAADAGLLAGQTNVVGSYMGARDAALNPYLQQLGDLTAQTQSDAAYFPERLHQIAMQTDRDVSQGRQEIGNNYNQTAGLARQADATAGASSQYGGQSINWNDPNNQIAQANRSLYDQRAAGTRRAGLADAGVLSALGANANANAFAGTPMTGGQLQAAAGASQNRAGQAYAAAQQRAQDLSDQGLSRGYEQTQQAYQRNQDALTRQRQAQLDVSGQAERNVGMNQGMLNAQQQIGQAYGDSSQHYRDQLAGLYGQTADLGMGRAQQNYDLGSGLQGLSHDLAGARGTRDLAAENQFYGTEQSALTGKSALADALRTGRLGFTQDMLGNIIKSIPESMKGMGSILSGFGEIVPF